jgi:hypothetical protein
VAIPISSAALPVFCRIQIVSHGGECASLFELLGEFFEIEGFGQLPKAWSLLKYSDKRQKEKSPEGAAGNYRSFRAEEWSDTIGNLA